MKEMDLMYAMTDLDDEFLKREPSEGQRGFRFRRFTVLAAVVALVSITVCSAMFGIDHQFGYDGDGYYTFDYRYPMEPVTICQEAYMDLEDALAENLMYYQNRIDVGDYTQPDTTGLAYSDGLDRAWLVSLGEELESMEDVEDYLGVTFRVSPQIRETVNSSFQLRTETQLPVFVTAYGPCYQDAAAEYQNSGSITPQGVGIEFSLDEKEKNWYTGLRVYIPLTEEFAEEFQPDTWYAPEGNGQYRIREYSNGTQEFVIAKVDYTEEYGGTCLALYDDGGIGYELYCCAYPADFEGEICRDSEKIILSLIEYIE